MDRICVVLLFLFGFFVCNVCFPRSNGIKGTEQRNDCKFDRSTQVEATTDGLTLQSFKLQASGDKHMRKLSTSTWNTLR